ncbi:MAG: hypothetical protein Q9195_006570 [Heterodermia aff. obscurata]
MATTITDLLSVREISPMHFESIFFPEKMGNTANQAYGGNTLAVAVNAALQTVPSNFNLYTAMGNFLGPALVDRTLHCFVRSLRTTKTFATRLVEVSQIRDDGQSRLCLFMTADFHVQEPHTLLTYSHPPAAKVSEVQHSPTAEENLHALLERGTINEADAKIHRQLFQLEERLLERRLCPESVMTQNFAGAARKGTVTTQDHLPLHDKTSSDYFRVKHHLDTPAEHVAALAFVMDMGISFLPLVHSGTSLTEAGVQSSLDFALRVFVNGGKEGVDLNKWNFREISTVTGGEGRTYTESRVWDEKGRMVCNMTQQSILRPKMQVGGKAKF